MTRLTVFAATAATLFLSACSGGGGGGGTAEGGSAVFLKDAPIVTSEHPPALGSTVVDQSRPTPVVLRVFGPNRRRRRTDTI